MWLKRILIVYIMHNCRQAYILSGDSKTRIQTERGPKVPVMDDQKETETLAAKCEKKRREIARIPISTC